ncbi:MAG: hypothetical protein ACTH02_06385 [Corynebacterium sp.]
MSRQPTQRRHGWWTRGATAVAFAAVGVGVTVGVAFGIVAPALPRDRGDGSDTATCPPQVSEFRHDGRSSQVYTFDCAGGSTNPGAGSSGSSFGSLGSSCSSGSSTGGRTPPKGVLIHLHGDGADEFDRGTDAEPTLAELARVAAARNMVLIAPRTPDHRRGSTWWRRLDSNTDWLSALVADRVRDDPGLDTGNIWWSGYSGGAEMISYGILCRTRGLVTGGALMMAGGGAPDEVDAPDGPSSGVRDVPLRWSVGDLDDGTRGYDRFDALTAAREGAAWYRGHGASDVTLEVLPGVAHLDFPQAETLNRVFDSALPS